MKRQGWLILSVITLLLIVGACAANEAYRVPRPYLPLVSRSISQCNTLTAADGPVSIPDNSAVGASSSITVTTLTGEYVYAITVTLNITHTYVGDLLMQLVDRDGITTTINNRADTSGDNFVNTHLSLSGSAWIAAIIAADAPFTDSTYLPDNNWPIGQLANGTWKLHIVDNEVGDTGQIGAWQIELCTDAVAPTATASNTPTASRTPTNTLTSTPSNTPTSTNTSTSTSTPTQTSTPTVTPTYWWDSREGTPPGKSAFWGTNATTTPVTYLAWPTIVAVATVQDGAQAYDVAGINCLGVGCWQSGGTAHDLSGPSMTGVYQTHLYVTAWSNYFGLYPGFAPVFGLGTYDGHAAPGSGYAMGGMGPYIWRIFLNEGESAPGDLKAYFDGFEYLSDTASRTQIGTVALSTWYTLTVGWQLTNEIGAANVFTVTWDGVTTSIPITHTAGAHTVYGITTLLEGIFDEGTGGTGARAIFDNAYALEDIATTPTPYVAPTSTPTNTLTPTATPTATPTKPVVTVRPVPTATPTTACGYRYCVAVTPTPPNRHGSPTPTFTPTPYISAVYANTTPVAIPDDSTPVSEVAAYSRITIGDLGQTAQVITVTLSITHTYIGDLAISLYDPNSATALLVSKVGKANGNFTNLKLRSNVTAPQIDDFGTADVYLVPPFEDSAYTFKPSNPFVIGAPVSGTWMLEVLDDVWGDIGTLGSWSIQFDTTQPTPTPMPVASAYLEVTTDRSGRTPVRSAQTAASGCINFSLPADTYYFWAYDSQWLLANPTIKTVPAGRNSCGFQYCVTANGAALADVLVAASTSPTGLNYVQTGKTDAAGCVELVLPAGTYYFFRQKAGYSWIDPDTEQVTP
jgi:subtilisin-like proprotein convertase family protein